MSFYSLLLLCLFVVALCSSAKPKTLVIVDDDFSKYTYSRFFKSLKKRGHKLQIKSASDKNIQLSQYGEFLYDNLFIIAPSAKKYGDVTYKELLQFLDSGGNILMAVDQTSSSELTRKFADRCGITIHDKNSEIRDHRSYDTQLGSLYNNVIVTEHWPEHLKSSLLPESETAALDPILFSGIGMSFKTKSHLTFSLLNGDSHTYSTFLESVGGPPAKKIISSGETLSLITALQLRNNGRVTIVGSTKMFSDEFLVSPVTHSLGNGKDCRLSGNEDFLGLVSGWTFGERGILRAVNVHHFKVADEHHTLNPSRYRISDIIEFEADLQEYRLDCDCWIPYVSDDVQFDFIRLDSFIRQFLEHDGKGHYRLRFTLPDIMGIFKFTIDYSRYGYSHLFVQELVSVRPFRHDEYQRFLPVAYPYYMGTFAMVVGFISFTFIFLFGTKHKKKVWQG